MANWTAKDIPDLGGLTAVVTGASSGIGEEAASELAGKGARVILAVRDGGRGDATAARILARYPSAKVEVSLCDMADLGSIRAFAARTADTVPAIDILLNNAGLGMQPTRATTADGFERQFGTNHLGHFALTGLLVPTLLKSAAPRVVTISSIAHRSGKLDFDDLQSAKVYRGGRAYSQSKLANLVFALELDRRARSVQSRLASIAAHPGVSSTGFMQATQMPGFMVSLSNVAVGVVGQDGAAGALPGLYAATMPDVKSGQYWGPDGLLEIRGKPAQARISDPARDREAATRLWTVSEELTGVRYPPLA